MKESALYDPVAKWLERNCRCNPAFTWKAGCGKDLAFPAGFGKRKPDVVTIHERGPRREVHLAEGKLLHVPTHGFDETVNQLDSLSRYADYLWAVFPRKEWEAASKNHAHWMDLLRKKGHGLLIVDREEVSRELDSHPNREVESEKKGELVASLVGEQEEAVTVPSISPSSAASAARAIARVAELMAGPVKELVGGNRKESTFLAPYDYNSRYDYYMSGGFDLSDDVCIQGDPLGCYLRDGRPVIWVWRVLGDLRASEKAIRLCVEKEHPEDTYFFSDNDNWQWECRPLSEVDINSLKASGFLGEFSIGRLLPVTQRTFTAFKNDLKHLCQWARRLK